MADYCTQDDVEKYMNITFTSNPDGTVALFITRVSAHIDRLCNRDFSPHTGEVEKHDGKGQGHNSILLKYHPVTAITSLTEDGDSLTEDDNYVWYDDGRVIKVSSGYEDADETYWKEKRKSIEVTYNHGYASVPDGIKDICTRWVVESLQQLPFRFEEGGIANSVSLEGVSVSYGEVDYIPEWVLKALLYYKKVQVA